MPHTYSLLRKLDTEVWKKYAFLRATNILPYPYFANETENTRFANTFIGKTCDF